MDLSTDPLEAMTHLAPALARLAGQLEALGMGLSLWDAAGDPVEDPRCACGICQVLQTRGDLCGEAMSDLAREIMDAGEPRRATGPFGCCLMGVPVYRRRRQAGAALSCFPVVEMLAEEPLARMCDRMQLDRRAVAAAARGTVRHSMAQADDLLAVLRDLLSAQQDLQTARDELSMLSANLASTYEDLSLMYRISGSMKLTCAAEEFLAGTCQEVREVADVEAVVVLIEADARGDREETFLHAGQTDARESDVRRFIRSCIRPRLRLKSGVLVENSIPSQLLPPAGIRNYVAAPLAADQEPIGLLVALNKTCGEFDSVDMKMLGSIGSQSAVFLTNRRLYQDMQELLMGVLHALTATIDAKDPYTCGHSQRVALITRKLAERLGFDAERTRRLYLTGLLHDIGKIGVPERILCKPGKLTDEEFETIKAHPTIGAKILSGIRQLDDVIDGILAHHERLDGRGYPGGLDGDRMPMAGRIVGLADGLDAMTSDRTYRAAMSAERAVEEIRGHCGTQFDPAVVDVLLAMDVEALLAETRREAADTPSEPIGREEGA
jgi:putative nucleotidyltransferase with HDIG domain